MGVSALGWMYTVLIQSLYPLAVTLKMWFPLVMLERVNVPEDGILPWELLSIQTEAPGMDEMATVPNTAVFITAFSFWLVLAVTYTDAV